MLGVYPYGVPSDHPIDFFSSVVVEPPEAKDAFVKWASEYLDKLPFTSKDIVPAKWFLATYKVAKALTETKPVPPLTLSLLQTEIAYLTNCRDTANIDLREISQLHRAKSRAASLQERFAALTSQYWEKQSYGKLYEMMAKERLLSRPNSLESAIAEYFGELHMLWCGWPGIAYHEDARMKRPLVELPDGIPQWEKKETPHTKGEIAARSLSIALRNPSKVVPLGGCGHTTDKSPLDVCAKCWPYSEDYGCKLMHAHRAFGSLTLAHHLPSPWYVLPVGFDIKAIWNPVENPVTAPVEVDTHLWKAAPDLDYSAISEAMLTEALNDHYDELD